MYLPTWIRPHLAALRALLLLTVVCGVLYPLVITGIVQLPALREKAGGSMIEAAADGRLVGSRLIGQAFTGKAGSALPQMLHSRRAAGNGYDPLATGASNLGPEDIVDVLPDPAPRRSRARTTTSLPPSTASPSSKPITCLPWWPSSWLQRW
ncbi:Potassium-transporting ATPase KdpC subunit [Streptomyces hirsutus]